jgi:hypothetical protein
MEVGIPQREVVVEPIADPIPQREPEPVPTPQRETPRPERVPA